MDKNKGIVALALLIGLVGLVAAETISSTNAITFNKDLLVPKLNATTSILAPTLKASTIVNTVRLAATGDVTGVKLNASTSISSPLYNTIVTPRVASSGDVTGVKGNFTTVYSSNGFVITTDNGGIASNLYYSGGWKCYSDSKYAGRIIHANTGQIYFDIYNKTCSGGNAQGTMFELQFQPYIVGSSTASLFPNPTNSIDLGTTSYGFRSIYAYPTAASASTYMCWDGSGISLLGSCSSLREYKKDIEDNPFGLDTLIKLQPRIFKLKSNDVTDIGFIADEVESVEPALAQYTNGNLSGININAILSTAVNAIKEQQTEIQLLQIELCKKDSSYTFCKVAPKVDTPITPLNGDLRVIEKFKYRDTKETKTMLGTIKPPEVPLREEIRYNLNNE